MTVQLPTPSPCFLQYDMQVIEKRRDGWKMRTVRYGILHSTDALRRGNMDTLPAAFSYQGETKDLRAESLYEGETKNLAYFLRLDMVARQFAENSDTGPQWSQTMISQHVLNVKYKRVVILFEQKATIRMWPPSPWSSPCTPAAAERERNFASRMSRTSHPPRTIITGNSRMLKGI